MDEHRRTGPTGPTSDEGKRVSRGNALKHGLAGAGVVLTDEEAEEVARRTEEWEIKRGSDGGIRRDRGTKQQRVNRTTGVGPERRPKGG